MAMEMENKLDTKRRQVFNFNGISNLQKQTPLLKSDKLKFIVQTTAINYLRVLEHLSYY